MQDRAGIEVVVVVGHHHVGPADQLLCQVVRTDAVLESDLSHPGLAQLLTVDSACSSRREPVIEAAGERA